MERKDVRSNGLLADVKLGRRIARVVALADPVHFQIRLGPMVIAHLTRTCDLLPVCQCLRRKGAKVKDEVRIQLIPSIARDADAMRQCRRLCGDLYAFCAEASLCL